MSKPKGSLKRKPQDSVKALQRWLAEEKERLVKEKGCPMCDGVPLPPVGDLKDPEIRKGLDDYWDTWTQPVAAVEARFNPCGFQFVHMNRGEDDFQVSDGPRRKGMTLERLQREVNKCTLMCKKCAGNVRRKSQHWQLSGAEPLEYKEPKEKVPEGAIPYEDGPEKISPTKLSCPKCGHLWNWHN
jgi:hypothetical protein